MKPQKPNLYEVQTSMFSKSWAMVFLYLFYAVLRFRIIAPGQKPWYFLNISMK